MRTARRIFTGGRLTVIVITFLVLVAFPLAAFAVSGNNVFITDPLNGFHVRVDPQHQLATSIHDVGSGQAAQVRGDGRLTTNVAGSVSAAVTFRTTDIVRSGPANGDLPIANGCPNAHCAVVMKPPTGRAVIITSIHVDTFKATATGSDKFISLLRSNDGSCSPGSLGETVELVHPASVGVTTLDYLAPGGLAVQTGTALCARSSDAANLQAIVNAVGYTVPPGLVALPIGGAR